LPGNGSADDCKNSRADHSANAERSERDGTKRFFQTAVGVLGVGNQLVNGFAAEKLAL